MKKVRFLSRAVPKSVLFIGAVLAACTSFLIYVLRINAVFIDATVFNGFSAILFGGNILCAALLFALFLLQAHHIEKGGAEVHTKKAFQLFAKIGLVFAGVFLLYTVCTMIFSDFEMRARLRTSIIASILPFGRRSVFCCSYGDCR